MSAGSPFSVCLFTLFPMCLSHSLLHVYTQCFFYSFVIAFPVPLVDFLPSTRRQKCDWNSYFFLWKHFVKS